MYIERERERERDRYREIFARARDEGRPPQPARRRRCVFALSKGIGKTNIGPSMYDTATLKYYDNDVTAQAHDDNHDTNGNDDTRYDVHNNDLAYEC